MKTFKSLLDNILDTEIGKRKRLKKLLTNNFKCDRLNVEVSSVINIDQDELMNYVNEGIV